MEQEKPSSVKPQPREPEWSGPLWKHPYMVYVGLTMLLFGFLVFMGWLAWTQGWIPQR